MVSPDDILDVLSVLAADRPVFHSEADFQHALAWRVHNPVTAVGEASEAAQPGVDLDLRVTDSADHTSVATN